MKNIGILGSTGSVGSQALEIVKINSVMNKEVAMWSLDIAQYFNLAYTQLKIANKSGDFFSLVLDHSFKFVKCAVVFRYYAKFIFLNSYIFKGRLSASLN